MADDTAAPRVRRALPSGLSPRAPRGYPPPPMTQPSRPDPLATAARVTGAARDLATDMAEGFRKSNRAFKLRTAVVGTWIVLALVTCWVACPPSGPTNSLGAVVQLLPESIMGTQVLVSNESDKLWTDVVFTLDGGWRAERKTVRGGDKLVLPTSSFKRGDEAAPAELKPKVLTIECEQGKVTAPLTAKP